VPGYPLRVADAPADIVLVHGGYHGAWCWELLRPELERRGHGVVTPDLPISDPDRDLRDYADAVAAAMAPDRPAMVVGHSISGIVIPLVADRRPVRRLVFLAAFIPQPDVSANEQRRAEAIDRRPPPSSAEWTDLGANVWAIGPTTARELFFHDVPTDLATRAYERLRPQAYGVFDEPSPLTAWPDVPSSSIVCRDDRSVNPAWSRAAARARLGVTAIEIDGGHSPFLSRPAELAEILASLAHR
jgi:pimeloyl-ACP methyl ester carboxylesterase